MLTSCLSRTRNHNWVPNRLTTQRYSTADRLDAALGKSLILGYIGLAYNTGSVLLLNDIVSDLEYELEAIRTSEIREEGVYQSENDGRVLTSEYVYNVLSICDMMIGKVKSSTELDLAMYIKDKFYLAVAEYYNMVYKKEEGEETVKSIDNVYVNTLKRNGMTIWSVSQPNNNMRSIVVLDSSKIQSMIPNIVGFMSSVTFLDATSDNYLCWLAGMCIEPDSNMINGPELPLTFVKRWFSPSSMDETIHALARGCSVKLASELSPHLRFVTQFLVKLREKQNIRLGQATNTVLRAALGGRNYIDKDIAYVLELLTSKNVPSKDEMDFIDEECIKAFKSSELYLAELDITSVAYIEQVLAPEDNPEEEEETDPEEDPEETPEEDPEETPEEDPDEEEDPLEGDDPMEDEDTTDGEEESPKKVSKTDDSKGITLSVQEGNGTIDEYLYRRELGPILTGLLENPPKNMSADKLAILRDIKYKWLYIFDVATLHNLLSKIIDLKIKVKTKVVA